MLHRYLLFSQVKKIAFSVADSIDEISLLISGQLGFPPVDVNSRNAVDRSALHWAAGNNNVDALKVLIQFGASVDAKAWSKCNYFVLNVTLGHIWYERDSLGSLVRPLRSILLLGQIWSCD